MFTEAIRLPFHLARFPLLCLGSESIPTFERMLERVDRTTTALDPWLPRIASFTPQALRIGLTRQLGRLSRGGLRPGDTILVGSRTEAWPAAEPLRGLTRATLELLVNSHSLPGLRIEVESASWGIARDADLLGTLDRHHAVRIRLHLTSASLQWLDVIETLAASGLEIEIEIDDAGSDSFGTIAALRRAGATRIHTPPGASLELRAAALAG